MIDFDREFRWRRARRTAGLWVAAFALGACSVDKMLEVPDPDVTLPGQLTGPQALPTLLAGAVADFQVAFSGTGGNTGLEGLANMTGLFTDEFFFTESFPTRVQVDRRAIERDNSTMGAIYFTVQRARTSARRAAAQYASLAPTDSGYSEALSLEGYSFLFLAEAYCSGVPVSVFDASGQLVNGGGTPLTTQQLLDSAIAKFTLAASVAGAARPKLQYLARVGQARALIFKSNANLASAAAFVAAVPTSFEHLIFSSDNTDRQNNGIWELTWNEGRWTQAQNEGGVGLAFRGSSGDCSNADPRTPCIDFGLGFDQSSPLFVSLKYPDRNAPMVLASGVEARLIEAEAALAAGNSSVFLTTLNNLRAAVPGLTPLADPGDVPGRQRLLFRERAFWLYVTNHRLGDMRRMVRSTANGGYGFQLNTVFPNGQYLGPGAGVYGPDVNFPIPVDEDNNPNFHGCIDRNP
jgi:hypothetical protein